MRWTGVGAGTAFLLVSAMTLAQTRPPQLPELEPVEVRQRRTIEELGRTNDRLRAEIRELHERYAGRNEPNAIVLQEAIDLQRQLTDLRLATTRPAFGAGSLTAQQLNERQRARDADLATQRERLQAELSTIRAQREELEKLSAEMATVRRENQQLQQSLATVAAERQQAINEALKAKQELERYQEVVRNRGRGERGRGAVEDGTLRTLAVGASGILGRVQIVQILGPTEMLVRRDDTTLWLAQISTANRVDDQVIELNDTFLISGTAQYESVSGGLRTVFKAVPVKPAP